MTPEERYSDMECTNRAVRALEDVVAVEDLAPGMKQVTTWSGTYALDARGDGCNCPDKRHNEPAMCKHEWVAVLADADDLPDPILKADSLERPPRPDDCECSAGEMPCFRCYRAGFRTPA